MSKITKSQVVEVLKGLPREKSNGGACLYRLPLNGDKYDHGSALADEPHCIAATALVELGLPLPKRQNNGATFRQICGLASVYGNMSVEPVYAESLDDEAIKLLCEAQDIADGNHYDYNCDHDGEATWGQAVDYLLETANV